MEKLMRKLCIAILIATPFLSGFAFGQSHSELWGKSGEKWSAQSRLPDFSFAGYHFGEDPIPTVPVVTDVTKYGARGDGKTDCTKAFFAAIKATKKGTIFIPEGRYVITGILHIRKSGIVLRGAGPEKTILVIPKSLQQITPLKMGTGKSSGKLKYSFTGGFVDIRGSSKDRPLGKVAVPAKRGDSTLVLATTPAVTPGQLVRLLMNNDPSLGKHIHAGLSAGTDTFKKKHFFDWVARVVSVQGKTVELDRPLRMDVRTEWNPELLAFNPTVSEVGIEHLSFEFPGIPKKGHLQEEGFNAIYLRGAVQSWVRNVHIVDADNAINVVGSRFCQIENVRMKANKRRGTTGHHALWATGNSQECLFTDFVINTKYIHDLTVEGFAHGNVFSKGKGVSLNFDHHRNGPYENLFTDLEVGDPRRLWACGGRGDRGPNSGARSTFWNIRWKEGKLSGVPHWPQINYIGAADVKPELSPDKRWVELLKPPIGPLDLHTAQRERRLKR